jgi:hypothetical protein
VLGTASIGTLVVNQTVLSTGSNQLGDSANDTQTLYGSVIIPTGSLTLTGSLTISGSTPSLRLGTSTYVGDFTNPTITFGSTSNGIYLDSSRLFFKAGGSFAGAFTSDGYVTNQIQIQGALINNLTTAMFIPYRLNAIGLSSGLGGDSSGSVTLITSGSTRLYVSGSGNVGIGTITPINTLDVSGTVRLLSGGSYLTLNNATYSELAYTAVNYFRANGASALINGPIIQFLVGGSEKVRVASTTGNFLINTTTDTGFKLDVNGNAKIKGSGATSATTSLRVENTNASASLVVLDNGFVGIGTIAPSASLHISGALSANLLRIDSPASSSILYVSGSGNVGIGTSTPITTLDISGSVRIVTTPSAGSILRPDNIGTAFQFGNATNTAYGEFRYKSDGGTDLARLLNTGNFGIGTITPAYKLDVYGTYHQSQSQGEIARYDISNANADQNRGVWNFYTNASATADFFGRFGFKFEGGTADSFKQFQVHVADSTTPKFVVDGSGRVGIGTIAPSASLHISGASNSGLLKIDSPALNNILYVSGSGNVGIGTTTPATTLEVNGVIRTPQMSIGGFDSGRNQFLTYTSGPVYRMFAGGAYGSLGVGSFSVGSTYGGISGSVNTVLIEGNTSIGTTTQSARLQVKGSGATSATTALRVENNNTSASLVVLDNGFVGINTGSAQYNLDVNGTARVSGFSYLISGATVGTGIAGMFPNGTAGREGVVIRGNLAQTDIGTDVILSNAQGNATTTSSVRNIVNISRGFIPTSGTGVFNAFLIDPTINQTGGANGITRGIYINPTLTAAADFRAIETTAGNVLFGGTGSVTISNILTLTPQSPLPSGVATGSFAVSSSVPPKPYFYDGTTWNALY